jgi:NAD(P)-dependent dehydrogenase (short-subunit alcohol dehydrogenase family)
MKLRDRKAFITGASRGIGRAIALAFAKEGASLALGARSMDALSGLTSEIEAQGSHAFPVTIDVGDASSIVSAKAAVAERLGHVHIVVNNAGIAQSVSVVKMDDAHWQAHLDINLTGTFRVTRAFLPDLIAEGWGRIINIASTAGKVGFQYTAAYCASKHGVIGFTRALALEMATQNITANAICPGFVNTDMTSQAVKNIADKTGGSEADALAWIKKISPQNRLVEPEEIAAVAVMLASEQARGITGQAINVDGGTVVY